MAAGPSASLTQRRAQAEPAPESAGLPLVTPPAVVVVSRRATSEEPVQRTSEPPPPTPAPPPAPAQVVIQRAPVTVEAVPAAIVQRATEEASEGSKAAAEEAESPEVDLDQVARDLLPKIKRLLAVERERQSRRW